MALILSKACLLCGACSSLIGASGAAMLAELFTAKCLGRDTGGSFGTSANALRPGARVEARCCVLNMVFASATSKCVLCVLRYELQDYAESYSLAWHFFQVSCLGAVM